MDGKSSPWDQLQPSLEEVQLQHTLWETFTGCLGSHSNPHSSGKKKPPSRIPVGWRIKMQDLARTALPGLEHSVFTLAAGGGSQGSRHEPRLQFLVARCLYIWYIRVCMCVWRKAPHKSPHVQRADHAAGQREKQRCHALDLGREVFSCNVHPSPSTDKAQPCTHCKGEKLSGGRGGGLGGAIPVHSAGPCQAGTEA